MKKILFVCLGNICRSPMAEFIMKDMLSKRGLSDEFEICSAGTSNEEAGNPVYPPAKEILADHGISCKGKIARKMTKDDYFRYDMLIGMESRNLRDMFYICSADPENKIFRLLDFTDDPHDVSDPWYSGDFLTTFNDISDGCNALINKLCGEKNV